MVFICNKKCSLFCLFISVWGTIQLLLMGVFFSTHSLAFIPYIPVKDSYDSLDEFREDADVAFNEVAYRCYASAVLYGLFAILSLICIRLKKIQMINRQNRAIRFQSAV
ncbi:ribonuclease kappa [Drosophila innubila]|uniref:ribonuclease kappa n=1 Tax=Drosophila innubila TaxID=198719 RepID=UPI00148D02E9|nr:ribonuclease kappa [Drosophila innubila]